MPFEREVLLLLLIAFGLVVWLYGGFEQVPLAIGRFCGW